MAKLILLRHGSSLWNEKNLFTGWVDIPLSTKGIQESLDAGQKIAHIHIDAIYVSSLIRAQMTALLAMSLHASKKVPLILHLEEEKVKKWSQIHSMQSQEECIPVHVAWQLNERMYGVLQGMDKDEMRQKYGAEQVHRWRRSFEEAPPEAESLKMTAQRVIPYFKEVIFPALKSGQNVLVAAHGNSLRCIVMFLDKLSEEEVFQLEIATGKPIIYSFVAGHGRKDGQ